MDLSLLNLPTGKINQFNKKGIFTVEDLTQFFPRTYHDFSRITLVSNLVPGESMVVKGTVIKLIAKSKTLCMVQIKDTTGVCYVTFFRQNFRLKNIKLGDTLLVGGQVSSFGNGLKSMTNPVLFTKDLSQSKIYPVYSKINGMSDSYLMNSISSAIGSCNLSDFIEPELLKKYDLISYKDSINFMHNPRNMHEIKLAEKRNLFNDLFLFDYHMKNNCSKNDTNTTPITSFIKAPALIGSLPFRLTNGQATVINSIIDKLKKGTRVNALVQGDVGCGKTLIAFVCAVAIAENGYQTVIAAPTNILAKQHYLEAVKLLEPLGFNIAFVSSECTAKQMREIKQKCASGITQIIIGTHSVFNLEYDNLGLIIVDEEHRFGVEQRDKLNQPHVHKISMSATPIPRTLAFSLFGSDIQVESVTSMPVGRIPVKTIIKQDDKILDVLDEIIKEVSQGHQAYIVCPFISDNENDTLSDVYSVEAVTDIVNKHFSTHGIKVASVTGNMKDADINNTLESFRNNQIQVLIATSIIEVGVNVPNATVIAILSADRFGFSSIHQLRGRVGRSNLPSYCYICAKNSEKFEIFKHTNDGLEIAKEDLSMRGTGAFLGTRQSGNNKYLMLIMENEDLNREINKDVEEIFLSDERKKWYYELMQIKE